MRRGTITTLLGLGLAWSAPGCGSQAEESSGRPFEYRHQGEEIVPVLNLGTWRYIPTGSGLRPSAGSIGSADPRVNYGLALRGVALKLTGDLPTLDEIKQMETAVVSGSNPQQVYEGLVRKYLDDKPRFSRQMVQYWRDTLRMGGSTMGLVSDTNTSRSVDLETGPNLAAQLTVDGVDMRKLFTQDRNTCPTYAAATGVFSPAACATARDGTEGLQEGEHAGILTQPAFMAHFYGNYAFRRARLVQELFSCSKFPAEFAATPERGDGFVYTSPWPKLTITSRDQVPYKYTNGTKVFNNYAQRRARGPVNTNVTDMSKYTYISFNYDCAGCHSSLNHQAPIFMNFDSIGVLRPRSMVQTPIDDAPFSQLADYLPPTEKLAFRYLKETPTVKDFGKAMADDPQVARCFVIRAWNRAMSRGDVVNELAIVPNAVVQDVTEQFQTSKGYNLKETLFLIYTHPSFIRF